MDRFGVRQKRRWSENCRTGYPTIPARRGVLRKILLVANPTSDLTGAGKEAEEVQDKLGARDDVRIVSIVGRDATVDRVMGALRSGEFDVLHYAGHALFDEAQPAESGLTLACPPGCWFEGRPNTSLLTAPSIWMLL